MFKIKPRQTTFIYGQDVYDNLIPRDHFLYKVNELVDFSFANEECKDIYSPDMGRTVTNTPEKMFRAEFVQYYYDLSDREMEEQAKYNIVVKWFLGLNLDEHGFDYSALSVFRSMLGEERHRTLFEKILGQIVAAGLITEEEKQYIDATNIIADIAVPTTTQLINDGTRRIIKVLKNCANISDNLEMKEVENRALKNPNELKLPDDVKKKRLVDAVVDARNTIEFAEHHLREKKTSKKCKKKISTLIEMQRQVLHDNIAEKKTNRKNGDTAEINDKRRKGGSGGRLVSYVDPDAKWGAKSGNVKFIGYKAHSTFSGNRFITNIKVTDGSINDNKPAIQLVDEHHSIGLKPHKVIADCMYGSKENRHSFKNMGVQLVAPFRPPTNSKGRGFTNNMFTYDQKTDSVTCPSGQVTTTSTKVPYNARRFRFDARQCAVCRSREQCTNSQCKPFGRTIDISDYHMELEEARLYNQSEEYREDMKARRCITEQKQAEMKQQHGLKRARYRGTSRVSIQAYLTAIVVNIKKFVKMIYDPPPMIKHTAT